ncbi:hypothetical protein O181_023651 [Austropuccinia psidii MF-1]|uniref:Integral membrane protein n=1 Tax=Austropuccinia psidii MF-1 TaxID=1389203 RepID=A0A9Q3CJT5_9BASI|nr:hypothetical protein [Austropuccinia psidii MF-1]
MASHSKPIPIQSRNRLLNFYLVSLLSRPLLTKSITAATLFFFQEIIAGRIAGTKPEFAFTGISWLDRLQNLGIDARAIKLSAYGGLISAPLNHLLMQLLHRSFPNHKRSAKSKTGMILSSMLFIAPIQNTVFLAMMAIINGAKSFKDVQTFWKRAIGFMTKVSWVLAPLSTLFADRFLSIELWVPFFNLVGFVSGTYFNQLGKKNRFRLEAAKRSPPQHCQKSESGDAEKDASSSKRGKRYPA